MFHRVACLSCGETHRTDVLALSFRLPDPVLQVWPRRRRFRMTSETIILDQTPLLHPRIATPAGQTR
jgi:hypothetical protein